MLFLFHGAFLCGKPKASVSPVLTFNGFSSQGGGERGKQWLRDILAHGQCQIHQKDLKKCTFPAILHLSVCGR